MASGKNLAKVLNEFNSLPEYSGIDRIEVDTKSLFGDYPINIAATRGDREEVQVLISSGGDINAQGEHGYTPLHNAVEQGNVSVVKLLVENGANLHIKNNDEDDPKDLAVLLEEEEIYSFLALACNA